MAEDAGAPVSDEKVLLISAAAKLAGMHPQTLRQYDRMGLVQPGRAPGGGRRYSVRDVALLREIQRLSQEDGVNLAGIKRIIALEQTVGDLRDRIAQARADLVEAYERVAEMEAFTAFPRQELLPVHRPGNALVVWRPSPPRRPA
ncbi:MerR family transcriptional regulator [Pilimelia terevasa]|uniref:MerR family transcriptional regulator n=1 Tax=Pilimelia terevasa TaxID=53372 RepID=A0A8J3BNJ8_9ACTN|nr:helix-turn-helix transcriptional regulator [Pilimelia terevasa]GGK35341.1 MerR family transcriptional regulator [Pilimelia terevasa]